MVAQQSLETCRPFLCVCPWQKLLEKIQINFRPTESRELIIFQQPPDLLNGRIEIFRVEILRFCSFSNFLKWFVGIGVVVVCVGWLLSWLHCSGWYTANRARWFPSQRPETETDVRGMTNSGKDFINVMKLGQAYICRCTQNSNRVFSLAPADYSITMIICQTSARSLLLQKSFHLFLIAALHLLELVRGFDKR